MPFMEKETVGMIGAHTPDKLPEEILAKVSRGLTKVGKNGNVTPDIAEKWKISPNGKGYAFFLRKNLYFSDGKNLTSRDINYNFSDASILRPDKYTIVFNLKDAYSPFLATVSRPILKNGFIGVSEYRVKKIKLNGSLVESVELYSEKSHKSYLYQFFYPTYNALKTAFALGELSQIVGLPELNFRNITLNEFKNVKITKKTNYKKLATLFFNTKDKSLSSKALREGLSYMMPETFDQGERNSSPLAHFSYVNSEGINVYRQDLEHSKLLIDKSETATSGAKLSLTINFLPKYEQTAKMIAGNWKKLNIDVKTKAVNQVPESFQIFLGEFNISPDPDQYILWHSSQVNNITHYDNPRIDKLLEDGRKELDIQKRVLIYSDFQKYLLSDPPASFLFFPYYYEVSRK